MILLVTVILIIFYVAAVQYILSMTAISVISVTEAKTVILLVVTLTAILVISVTVTAFSVIFMGVVLVIWLMVDDTAVESEVDCFVVVLYYKTLVATSAMVSLE